MVSLQPSATVTLRDLGLLDRLVACTKYCSDVCPEIAPTSVAIVSDSWSAQAQQIVAARPDLVLASVPYQIEAVAEILKAGVRFLGLAPRTLADIYADIAAIAGLMGAGEHGKAVIAGMQTHIESVRQRTARAPKQKVFCEEWGKPIIASQPWVAELVDAAGGEFVGERRGRRNRRYSARNGASRSSPRSPGWPSWSKPQAENLSAKQGRARWPRRSPRRNLK